MRQGSCATWQVPACRQQQWHDDAKLQVAATWNMVGNHCRIMCMSSGHISLAVPGHVWVHCCVQRCYLHKMGCKWHVCAAAGPFGRFDLLGMVAIMWSPPERMSSVAPALTPVFDWCRQRGVRCAVRITPHLHLSTHHMHRVHALRASSISREPSLPNNTTRRHGARRHPPVLEAVWPQLRVAV